MSRSPWARRLRELAVAQDRAQDVVEVVRDAAREVADSLHLLGLAQLHLEAQLLLLGAHLVGNVLHEADHAPRLVSRLRASPTQVGIHAHRGVLAVVAPQTVFHRDVGDLAFEQLLAQALQPLPVLRMHALHPLPGG